MMRSCSLCLFVLLKVYKGKGPSGCKASSKTKTISERLVQQARLTTVQCEATQVTVADGSKLSCTSAVNNLSWWTQGYTFSSDARVLPLPCYDLILGMDWLEQHSPMWVHWKRKKMRFSHKGARITLKGVKDCTSTCPPLKLKKLKGLMRKGGVAQIVQMSAITQSSSTSPMPTTIEHLVHCNKELFQEPQSLPPQRDFDHSIPLIQGVKPVNIKPYRYSPTQKDEIETQV